MERIDGYDRKAVRCFERSLVVVSNLGFPIDMLRYDNCVPAGEEDAHKIEASRTGSPEIRVIELKIVLREKKQQPTIGRWNSMGWMVLEFDGEETYWAQTRQGSEVYEVYRAYVEKRVFEDEA